MSKITCDTFWNAVADMLRMPFSVLLRADCATVLVATATGKFALVLIRRFIVTGVKCAEAWDEIGV